MSVGLLQKILTQLHPFYFESPLDEEPRFFLPRIAASLALNHWMFINGAFEVDDTTDHNTHEAAMLLAARNGFEDICATYCVDDLVEIGTNGKPTFIDVYYTSSDKVPQWDEEIRVTTYNNTPLTIPLNPYPLLPPY